MIIEKKLWPERFELVLNGTKKSDVRLADFEAKPGDIIILREWDPDKQDYTGRIVKKEIASVIKTKDLPHDEEEAKEYGFQIFSFKD